MGNKCFREETALIVALHEYLSAYCPSDYENSVKEYVDEYNDTVRQNDGNILEEQAHDNDILHDEMAELLDNLPKLEFIKYAAWKMKRDFEMTNSEKFEERGVAQSESEIENGF